mgnify:CR=1 FL=1
MTRARNSANLASHGNLFVDITNDRTGIGSVVPGQSLHVAGTAGFHADTTFTGDLYNATWDRSDNSLKFVDNAKAKFGTGGDLEIYHDGSETYIQEVGTGSLNIRSGQVNIQGTNGENMANLVMNSSVKLRYDNAVKFETTDYGTNTTGTAVNDGLVVAGVATVTTMNVTGVLTYDDVTSVDSVGVITARSGVDVTGTLNVTGVINTTVAGGNNQLKIETTSSGDPSIYFAASGSGGHNIEYIRSSNTLNFKQAGGSVRLSITAAGHTIPGTDSLYDLGLTGTRWRNVYADTLYGDGSNLTGIAADKIFEGNSSVEVIDTGTGQIDVIADGSYVSRFKKVNGNRAYMLVGNPTAVGAGYGTNSGHLIVLGNIASEPATLRLFGWGPGASDGTVNNRIEFASHQSGSGGQTFAKIESVIRGSSDNSSDLTFHTASSATVTEKLRITSDGKLLVGTQTEGQVGADDLTLATSGNTGITIRSGTSNAGNIYFSDATSGTAEYAGYVSYSHSTNSLSFGTNDGTESIRILSNQSICMGGSLQAGANGGVNIESTSSGSKPVGLSLINQGTADDSGFTVSYRGKDDAGNQEDFAYLKFTAQDTANGAEDGNLEIWTVSSGSLTKKMQIGPGKPNGEPTAFVFMDSNASGASSEECLRLSNLSDTAYNWCTVSFAVNNSVQWKAGAQRHGAGGGADFFLINNGNDRFRVGENGKIRSPYTYSGTTTGGGPIYVESDGDFLRYTSSRKYKTDIETLEDARADKILDCRPVWYKSLSENDIKTPGADKSDWGWYGFIAEEVAEIEPRLVNWATKDAGTNPGDGFASVERDPSNYEAEGVRYDNFVPLLVNLVKRQKAEIESLKSRLDTAGL